MTPERPDEIMEIDTAVRALTFTLNAMCRCCFAHNLVTNELTVPKHDEEIVMTDMVVSFVTLIGGSNKLRSLYALYHSVCNPSTTNQSPQALTDRQNLFQSEIQKEVETLALDCGFVYRPFSKNIAYSGPGYYVVVSRQLRELADVAVDHKELQTLCGRRKDLVLKISTDVYMSRQPKQESIVSDLFELARAGRLGKDFQEWGLADESGRTVAHIAAIHGTLPDGFNRWGIRTPTGWTVADTAALYGHLVYNPEAAKYRTKKLTLAPLEPV